MRITLALPPLMGQGILELVRSGRYQSFSQVVRQAILHLLRTEGLKPEVTRDIQNECLKLSPRRNKKQYTGKRILEPSVRYVFHPIKES
jgi:Arc/MetJ-type ribon-helix-helix transcriptional regulator